MSNIYKLRTLPFALGIITLTLSGIARFCLRITEIAVFQYGLVLTVVGVVFWRAMIQTKKENLVQSHSQGRFQSPMPVTPGKLLKEVAVTGFDPKEIPVIRIFNNGVSSLIFEVFPPENKKMSTEQIDHLTTVLSEITGVEVLREDRESFLILSNSDEVIDRIVSFLS